MKTKPKTRRPRWTKAHTDMLRDVLSESVHTAFRKGCRDDNGVWRAIADMNPDEWDSAVEWMLWAIDVSLRGQK